MKKVFVALLKGFGILLLMLVATVTLAIFVFAVVPEIVVPEWLIKKGISYAPAEAKLSYKKFDVRFIKESLNQKRLTISMTDVCIDYKEKAIVSCFDELDAAVSFKLLLPELKTIYPLKLTNAKLAADLNRLGSDNQQKQESSGNPLDYFIREILPKWKLAGTKVELKSIEVITGESRYVTSLLIDATKEESTAVSLRIPSFKEANTGFPHGNLVYKTHWPTINNKNYQSNAEVNASFAAKKAIALTLETQSSSWRDIAYDLKAKFNGIVPLNFAEISGNYSPTQTKGLLSLQLGGPQSEIKQLNLLNCGFDIKLEEKQGDLKCGPQQVSIALKERPTFKTKPEVFKIAPTFALSMTNFSYEKGFNSDFKFDLDLEHLKFFLADVSIAGSLDTSGESLQYTVKTNSELKVESFKSLVRFLRDTPLAVPAPINVMDGKVTLAVNGEVTDQEGEIKFDFMPDLSSQYQRLLLTLGGRLELENRQNKLYKKLVLSTDLKEIKLSFPRLELASPPQFLPDSRFKLAEVRKKREVEEGTVKSGSTFSYDVDVQTPTVGSIAVATNLTKNPIPVGVDLNVDSRTGLGPGEVQIGKVALELFRRKAFLQELNIEFQEDGDKFLDGNIAITYLDYDITITVAGSVEEPQIIMSSVPPLSRDQIISVLLFGKAPDDLDEAQRSSVGNVSSAIADAALSFSSLYFLASTPVESVGYDAQRGVVTAKVGLGRGTSLELGSSGSELSEVGVRRRLGKNWYLNSYVEDDSQTDQRSVSAFIEWVRRF